MLCAVCECNWWGDWDCREVRKGVEGLLQSVIMRYPLLGHLLQKEERSLLRFQCRRCFWSQALTLVAKWEVTPFMLLLSCPCSSDHASSTPLASQCVTAHPPQWSPHASHLQWSPHTSHPSFPPFLPPSALPLSHACSVRMPPGSTEMEFVVTDLVTDVSTVVHC